MGSIYQRNGVLYVRFKNLDGKWKAVSSKYRVGQEHLAELLLMEVEERIARLGPEQVCDLGNTAAKPTVAEFAAPWLEKRSRRGVRTWKDDRARLQRHVLPILGSQRLDEVRPKHVRRVIEAVKAKGLAPKTVRNVYATLRSLFRDAKVDDLVADTPCVLPPQDLGPMHDKDPAWRPTAIMSRDELEQLISDERIPVDRRVIYALCGVGGLRTGEACGLLWSRWSPELRPLGRLDIVTSYTKGGTKTLRSRLLPVHPVLGAVLSEWRLSGWARAYGRPPGDDDIVVPTLGRARVPDGRMRNASMVWHDLQDDLAALGLRPRRVHDFRRTFITLVRADGARKDLLRLVTHGPEGDIVDIYTEMPWEPLCAEVAKLRVRRRSPEPEVLQIAVGAEASAGPPDDGSLVTPLVTVALVPEEFQGVGRRPQRDLNAPRAGALSHRLAPFRPTTRRLTPIPGRRSKSQATFRTHSHRLIVTL